MIIYGVYFHDRDNYNYDRITLDDEFLFLSEVAAQREVDKRNSREKRTPPVFYNDRFEYYSVGELEVREDAP